MKKEKNTQPQHRQFPLPGSPNSSGRVNGVSDKQTSWIWINQYWQLVLLEKIRENITPPTRQGPPPPYTSVASGMPNCWTERTSKWRWFGGYSDNCWRIDCCRYSKCTHTSPSACFRYLWHVLGGVFFHQKTTMMIANDTTTLVMLFSGVESVSRGWTSVIPTHIVAYLHQRPVVVRGQISMSLMNTEMAMEWRFPEINFIICRGNCRRPDTHTHTHIRMHAPHVIDVLWASRPIIACNLLR